MSLSIHPQCLNSLQIKNQEQYEDNTNKTANVRDNTNMLVFKDLILQNMWLVSYEIDGQLVPNFDYKTNSVILHCSSVGAVFV